MTVIENMGKKAKDASRVLATAGAIKNKALNAVADALIDNTDKIVKANDIDLENGKAAGLTPSLLDRLKLGSDRIK